MPQKRNSPEPEVMTWGKATPAFVFAVISDLVRIFFEFFWFFGPALVGAYCTSKVGDVAIVGGLLATGCAAGVTATAAAGFAFTATFGSIMAMATGFAGWLVVGGYLMMFNRRILKENALWLVGSLVVSEVPFINSLPVLSGIVWKMYRTQIKVEKAALAKWKKENADAQLQERQRQTVMAAQAQATRQAQIQQERVAEQEERAVENGEINREEEISEAETATPQAHIQLQPVPPQFQERPRITPALQLTSVPNYTASSKVSETAHRKEESVALNSLSLTQSAQFLKSEIASESPKQAVVELAKLDEKIEDSKFTLATRVEMAATNRKRESGSGISMTTQKLEGRIIEAHKLTGQAQETIQAEEMRNESVSTLVGKPDPMLQAYERELERRSVGNITKRNNAFMVHGLELNQETADKVSTNRGFLRSGLGLQQKLDLILSLSPTLSASTVREGKVHDETGRGDDKWSSFGVLLKGGNVKAAHKRDADSKAYGLYGRTKGKASDKLEAIDEAVGGATSGMGGYNELITSAPEVAGLYISVNAQGLSDSADVDVLRTLNSSVESGLMPVYAMNKSNQTFEVLGVDIKTRHIKLGKQVTPEQLLQRKGPVLSENDKDRLASKLIEDSVFDPQQLRSKEDADRYAAMQGGHEAFVRMAARQGVTLSENKERGGTVNQRTVRNLGKEVIYKQTEDGLERTIIENGPEQNLTLPEFMDDTLELGFHSYTPKGRKSAYGSPQAILDTAKEFLSEVEKNKDDDQYKRQVKEKVAFFLHGFAAEAEFFGKNPELAAKARELTNSIAPNLDIGEFYRRRVGDREQFIITKEDLK